MAATAPKPNSVSHDIEMVILLDNGTSVPMPCTMSYTVEDPFAVSATFRSAEGSVTWIFARELLSAGLESRVGDGDIRVSPVHRMSRSLVRLELSSDSGAAVLEGPLPQLRAFIEATMDVLPAGYEWQYLNFDSGLADLLGDGPERNRHI